MLSMDSLLARLAFLQTVWLLPREKKKNQIKRGEKNKKIHVKEVNVYNERAGEWLNNKVTVFTSTFAFYAPLPESP